MRLVDHRRVAVQVAHIDREAHAILEARALGFRDQFEIEKGAENAGLRVRNQSVGRQIDALHPGRKDEVPGPCA